MVAPQERGRNHNQEIFRIERRETEFPSDIDGRMEAILSSFNAAPKASTHLLLTKSMIDPLSLNRLFRGLMRETMIRDLRDGTASSYCQDSLCRIGLVAKEINFDYFGKEVLAGFIPTVAGETYGWPIAAFFLSFEKEHGFSLYPIFGQSQQGRGEHRAPLTRAKILKFLIDGKKRQVDLCIELGINHQLASSSLKALKKAGVIDYSSMNPQTGREQVAYAVSGEVLPSEVKPVRQKKRFTNTIIRICQGLTDERKEITQANVYDRLPRSFKKGKKPRNVRTAVTRVLVGLADKQGFLKRGKFKGRGVYSEIELTEKGRTLVDELILPLENALSDGMTLGEWQKVVLPNVMMDFQEHSKVGADLYYPYSKSYQVAHRQEWQDNAMFALHGVGRKGISAQELSELLGIGEMACGNFLKSLVGERTARREMRNGVYYYRLLPRRPPVKWAVA